MNKTVLSVFALLPISIASANAFETSRFSGEFSLNSGFSSTNSNLITQGSEQINHLGKGETSDNIFVAPLGSLYYALTEQKNQRVYLGTSRDDLAVGTLAFELGYQYDYQNGTKLDIAYLPTVLADEVWANPYLTGQKRETTDRQGNAYRLKLSNLWNSGVSLDMAYATAEIDNESIGYAELQRDSDSYFIKGQYRTMLNRNAGYITAFSYTHHDAAGDAASFNSYKAELSYFYLESNYRLSLTGSYELKEYSAENPIFAQTRSDDVYRLFLGYEYDSIPSWDNWSIISFVGTTINDSNINFYKSDSLLMSVGVNYKF
ncbi:TPA: DUF2860 domain-containing protein [Vibrio vulnificus]|nr:DUF2860 domain-containing protein [Vibrio vulnificus]HAT8486453.1 DUF2860 domain-containing protein [Vibrio vulnificus]HAT8513510.1 DUF2860 domain-containing protein [Vibrio vulnificus]